MFLSPQFRQTPGDPRAVCCCLAASRCFFRFNSRNSSSVAWAWSTIQLDIRLFLLALGKVTIRIIAQISEVFRDRAVVTILTSSPRPRDYGRQEQVVGVLDNPGQHFLVLS